MKRLGTILLLVFAAIALVWGGFISGKGWQEHKLKECVKKWGETMELLERVEKSGETRLKLEKERSEIRLNECYLKLPRR